MLKSSRIIFAVSGEGRLMGYLHEELLKSNVRMHVISDRPCRALDTAQRLRIPYTLVERKEFGPSFESQRNDYSAHFARAVVAIDPDLIVFTGFYTILNKPGFVEGVPYLNIHPSLLPKHRGHYAVRDALEDRVEYTGCTVHRLVEEVDAGEILSQARVPVLPGDTIDALHSRIREVEKGLYLWVIKQELAAIWGECQRKIA